MNFLTGFIILLLLFAPAKQYFSTEIGGFSEGFPYRGESMLMEGDKILKINGYNIYTYNDISLFLAHGAGKPYDILVERGGKEILIKGVALEQWECMTEIRTENGTEIMPVIRYGLEFRGIKAGFEIRSGLPGSTWSIS